MNKTDTPDSPEGLPEDRKSKSDAGFVPQRYERHLAIAANAVAIISAPVTWLAGLSLYAIAAVSFSIFVVLTISVLAIAEKEPRLVRTLLGAALISLFVTIGAYGLGASETQATEDADPAKPAPPRIEIQAWLERPNLESDGKGGLVETTGDGIKGHQEPSLTPIEIFTPDRVNSTNIYRSPGYFSSFEPGETIVAKVCGLEFTKETYPKSDRRYTDVIVWKIPVPASEQKNCIE